MKNSPSPSVAWHYTTVIGMAGINETGFVSLATHDIGPSENPVAWFSTNPTLERTLREMAYQRADGSYVRAQTVAEHRVTGHGLYRIASETAQLHRWVDLVKVAGISHTRRRNLEKMAHKAGAVPYEWYGRMTPLPLTEALGVDYYDGVAWKPLALDEISQRLVIEQQAAAPLLERMLRGSRADAEPMNSQTLDREMDLVAKDRRAAARP